MQNVRAINRIPFALLEHLYDLLERLAMQKFCKTTAPLESLELGEHLDDYIVVSTSARKLVCHSEHRTARVPMSRPPDVLQEHQDLLAVQIGWPNSEMQLCVKYSANFALQRFSVKIKTGKGKMFSTRSNRSS